MKSTQRFYNIFFLSLSLFVSKSLSQSIVDPYPARKIIDEFHQYISVDKPDTSGRFSVSFKNLYYNNSNLPNFENQNGNYYPKGYGNFLSFLLQFNLDNINLTAEPMVVHKQQYEISIPKKENEFSVLNDVPIIDIYKQSNFRNIGIQFHNYGLLAGFGNWNQWWGPGIHNSLSLSNNSEGFYHYFIGTNGDQSIVSNIDISFKYLVSAPMHNFVDSDYFLSAWFLKVKNNFLELGMSYNILSGGYYDLSWEQKDAIFVLFSKKNLKYWDTINSYYILGDIKNLGLKVFFEIGYPNRSFAGKNAQVYYDHALGSNLGLRKYGFFGNENIVIGFEYTRLVQGIYYNILPTPNWYDNIKYNYSSYKGRRWGAHSGSDSDDLLLFFGYIGNNSSFIYGFNYERHGVTFHFPPEVKLESRISFSYKYKNTQYHINYENEYFEHYGFVDNNSNVWEESFEPGSIQRTNTLLLSIEKKISF